MEEEEEIRKMLQQEDEEDDDGGVVEVSKKSAFEKMLIEKSEVGFFLSAITHDSHSSSLPQ